MTPHWYVRDLSLGMHGEDVAVLRRLIGLPPSKEYDRDVEVHVKGEQRAAGLPATGIVDEATAAAIGETQRYGLVPRWYTRTLILGDAGADVGQLRYLLGFPRTGLLDEDVEAAVRRFQSQHRIAPTGIVDQQTAVVLGEDVPRSSLSE